MGDLKILNHFESFSFSLVYLPVVYLNNNIGYTASSNNI